MKNVSVDFQSPGVNVLRMLFLINLVDCSDWIFDRIHPIMDMHSLQYQIGPM